MVYYSKRIQIKNSRKKSHVGQGPGGSKYRAPNGPPPAVVHTCLFLPAMTCDNTRSNANRGHSPEPWCPKISLGLSPIEMADCPRGRLVSSPCRGGADTMWTLAPIINCIVGTSLVVQWLGISLPMRGTRVRALVQEDPTCRAANKPMCRKYRACALEPASHNYDAHTPQLLKPVRFRNHMPQLVSPRAATTEACAPRARAPQQEKPPQ